MTWVGLGVMVLGAACAGLPATPLQSADEGGAHMQTLEGRIVPGDGRRRVIEIKGSTIVAVRERGAGEKVDVEADIITAGFVDAHAHPLGLGQARDELDLTGVASYREALQQVAEAASDGTGWLIGRGWDQNDWPDVPSGGWPRAMDLDPLTPGRPVLLRRIDGHALWLDHDALAASKIGPDTEDPPGGRIIRNSDGSPSGVLVDSAMDLVRPPAPTPDQWARWLSLGTEDMADVGLCGVHVMGASDAQVDAWRRLDREGRLPIRVWLYVDADSTTARRLLAEGPWRGIRLQVVGIKVFADGALGSRGAHLLAPYADEPETSGLVLTSRDAMAELTAEGLSVGLQVAVHAIGDAAVRSVLDAFGEARRREADADVRLRVEHAQIVHPDDLPRFAQLQAIASMQPTHATSDAPWAHERLGADRLSRAYPWRSLHEAGAILAFGSDAPVEDPNPALGLWAAVTRTDPRTREPEGGFTPAERIDLDLAVEAFTSGAATAVHEEARLGRVQPGFVADLTLWRVEQEGPPTRWVATHRMVEGDLIPLRR
ncbi:MAG: amidohydrolase [Myxococcota bacterium]